MNPTYEPKVVRLSDHGSIQFWLSAELLSPSYILNLNRLPRPVDPEQDRPEHGEEIGVVDRSLEVL